MTSKNNTHNIVLHDNWNKTSTLAVPRPCQQEGEKKRRKTRQRLSLAQWSMPYESQNCTLHVPHEMVTMAPIHGFTFNIITQSWNRWSKAMSIIVIVIVSFIKPVTDKRSCTWKTVALFRFWIHEVWLWWVKWRTRWRGGGGWRHWRWWRHTSPFRDEPLE